MLNLNLEHTAPPPKRKDYAIGVVGAGFIVRDIHLVAYAHAGYNVQAISCDVPAQARQVAELRSVPKVYDTYQEMLADPAIEILDIAIPPHAQQAVVREAVKYAGRIKGILAQKPLAVTYQEARETARLCADAGIVLGINQNMRYDHSIRALKTVLEPRLARRTGAGHHRDARHPALEALACAATIVSTILNHEHPPPGLPSAICSATPRACTSSARTDPRTKFPHRDGIMPLHPRVRERLPRAALGRRVDRPGARGRRSRHLHQLARRGDRRHWRRAPSAGPAIPTPFPSTIDFTTAREPGVWFAPRWTEVWFPDAFEGTMGVLLDAVASGTEPAVGRRGQPAHDGSDRGLLPVAR